MMAGQRRHAGTAWVETRNLKTGRHYRVRWIEVGGSTGSESCGKDRAYARVRCAEKTAELQARHSGRPVRTDKRLSDLKAELAVWMAHRSAVTVRKSRASVQLLIDKTQDRRLAAVDREQLMTFRAARLEDGVSSPTVNKDLRQIKAALSYAVDAGWLAVNVAWRWRGMRLTEPENTVRVVEAAELAALLEAADDPTLADMIQLAWHQGLRRTECCQLRWSAVDLDNRLLHVRNVVSAGELTKSRRNRVVPMRAEVAAMLERRWSAADKKIGRGGVQARRPHVFVGATGRAVKPDWVTHAMVDLVGDAGIELCTFHDLRRSFSTLAQRAGVPASTVQELGGWSTVDVVRAHYTGQVDEGLRRAMDTIEHEQRKGVG
jgi:integrase